MEGQAISGTTLAAVAFEASASYEQIRPTYPLETVRFLLKKLGILEHNKIENYTFTRNLPLTVLELGSGTGKFTRVMFEILRGTGTQIIASDPTGTMIQQFQRVLPRIEILQCRAENIALPDSSVDAIVAAHCFHWFANEEAVRDICRVLVPGGSLGMIWILPDESLPWVKELLTFFRPLENGFEHTTSEETINKIFQMVGKLFTVQKDSTTRKHWQLTYDECYNTLASKGILQSSPDEVKDGFKVWFDKVMRKHFPDIKENDWIPCPSVTLICWCKKKEMIQNLE